jgi:hypothetical protein
LELNVQIGSIQKDAYLILRFMVNKFLSKSNLFKLVVKF